MVLELTSYCTSVMFYSTCILFVLYYKRVSMVLELSSYTIGNELS